MEIKKKILLVLVISLIITVVLAIFVINPLFRKVKESSEELALAKKEEAIFLERKRTIENMKVILKGHRKDFEKMEDLLVDYDNPLEFIDFLEGEAVKVGIELEISSLSFKESQDLWPAFVFSITVKGSFPGLLRFFERLESAPYLIQVDSLNLKRAGKVGDETTSPEDVSGYFLMNVFTR